MARGPRYLKLRHRTWYFQIDVPRDLRTHFEGKANFDGVKIVKTTGERDISIAQPVALRITRSSSTASGQESIALVALQEMSTKASLRRSGLVTPKSL